MSRPFNRLKVSAKLPGWKTMEQGHVPLSSLKYLSATGSRSHARSIPSALSNRATADACPPAPKVQSTTRLSGRTSNISTSSSVRTGTCAIRLSISNAVGSELRVITLPPLLVTRSQRLRIPDLKPVAPTHDLHLPRKSQFVNEL